MVGDRGHRPRRARLAAAPRRRRDRQGRPDPDRARRARRALDARTHPLLGRAVGPRLADRGRRGALELSGALRGRPRAPDAARRDARPTSRPSSTRLLDACRAADAALVASRRTLLVREPFEVAPDAAFVALVRDAVTATLGAPPAIGGASYWADAAFIAAAGIPTVMFGPSGEGAHALEEWVSIADTEAVARMLVAVAKRSAHERARQPRACDPRAVPAPSPRPRAFHASLPGYGPTPLRDLPALAAELGLARRAAEGRVRPARPAGFQGARRVVGGRARAARAPRRPDARRRQRRQPRPRRRARRGAARAALPRLPAGALAERPPRGDRGRGRRGRDRRRRLRGGRRGGGAAGTARGRRSRSPTSATPDPARWVIDGYATLFAEAAAQGAFDVLLVPSASARSPPPRRASARRPASR